MTPIFDKDRNLVAWISENIEHIFDLNLSWIGFTNEDNVFRAKDLKWVGPVKTGNFYDNLGKPFAWTETPIQLMLTPLTPLRPLRPLKPLTPLKPFKPLTPIKPVSAFGGWSESSFAQEFGV